MKTKIILLFNILLLFFLASCSSGIKIIEKQLNDDLAKVVSLDNDKIDEIIMVTNAPVNNKYYRNLIKEMLKNLKYEIVSIKEDKDSKKVVATIELTTQKNELLINDFFNTVIEESIAKIMQGKSVDKNEIFEVGIKNMYETYKNSFNSLSSKKTMTNLVFEKNKEKKWILTNPNVYYNALLGEMFTKIDEYNENQLPETFLNAFLSNLKKISPKEIATLFGKENDENQKVFEVIAKFYNNTNFSIISKEKIDNKTNFKVKVDLLDAKKFYQYVEDEYIAFFKKANDNKQTPTIEQSSQKLNDLFVDGFDINKENIISKDLVLIINNSLNIENIYDFFSNIMLDFITESNNFTVSKNERLKNLYEIKKVEE